jgi:capsular polysaccharide biosynthesis protein
MSALPELTLHRRPIENFAAIGLMGPGGQIEHRHSLPPTRIRLPPIEAGRAFLEQWQLRELPDQDCWRADHYTSYAPPLFLIHQALVQSSAGIVAVGDQVIAETLGQTNPALHGYRNLARGIGLPHRPIRRLAGTHISLLAAGEGNYFHSLLDGLARIMAVPENYQAAATGLLVPKGGARQGEVLALLDLMPSLRLIEVGREETLLVETLLLPLSVTGESSFHPVVSDFYRTITTNVSPPRGRLPRRIYIDRRASPARPLTNESAVIAALTRYGFEPVRLESMSVADQIRLFRGAEAVVAPHGAALTNIGFCRPGTLVIELLMDAYCHWCFRHLAGLMQLRYDCVLGRARKPWAELDLHFHATRWEISVNHVAAAVAQHLQQAAAA